MRKARMSWEDAGKYLSWLVKPGYFFRISFKMFSKAKMLARVGIWLLSCLFPLVTILSITFFWLKNPISDILARWVPGNLEGLVYFCFFGLLLLVRSGFILAVIPTRRFLDNQGMKVKRKIRKFSLLNLTRQNFCSIPGALISSLVALSFTPFQMNVIQYGIYLTVVFWMYFAWNAWITVSSMSAIPVIAEHARDFSGLTMRQHSGRRVLLAITIAFTGLDLGLLIAFPLLVGGQWMPLFFKVAYFLMHGN